MRIVCVALLACLAATAVQAEFAPIRDAETFRGIVAGKTLTRPLVRLQVSPDGAIRGTGLRREVTGRWTWQDGYFCRDLFWGGDSLGHNCQAVAVRGDGRIRFISDRGAGDYADFRLR